MLAVVAVVGFAFFLAWELTDKHPIVDLRLFMRRNFLMGTLSLSVAYGLFFGNVVLLPLWLQQYMGYTATWAGLATAPVGILAIILSPWVGKNVAQDRSAQARDGGLPRLRADPLDALALQHQADFSTILIPTVLQGAAMAFFFIPLQAIIFSGLTPDRLPAAAGLWNFVRITAGAIGTSIFTTLWENRAILHHSAARRIIDAQQRARPARDRQLGASGYNADQALARINRLIDQQAYTMAVTDMFYIRRCCSWCWWCWSGWPSRRAAAAVGRGGGRALARSGSAATLRDCGRRARRPTAVKLQRSIGICPSGSFGYLRKQCGRAATMVRTMDRMTDHPLPCTPAERAR